MQLPLGYRHFHHNPSINYQFNRWLPEAQEAELLAAAERIEHLADVKTHLLNLAETATNEGRWLHAATYFRGAEFFMPFNDPDKLPSYAAYRNMFQRAFHHVCYERLSIDHDDGALQAIRIRPTAPAIETLVIHGGFDSYMEEFFQWGVALSGRGYDVVLFEGPGQGAAIRESSLTMSPTWEHPVATLLDALDINRCTLIGFSLGGYLALRAAAFEPRISQVVLINALVDFLDCFLHTAPAEIGQMIRSGLENNERRGLNELGQQLRQNPDTAWALDHGEHISGSTDTFDFLQWTAAMNTREFSASVTQPCFVTGGTTDHIVPVAQFFEQIALLGNSQALTARLYSDTQHAGAHCQVGNLALVFDDVEGWLKKQIASQLP